MRTIKFRAWDTDIKQMLPPVDLSASREYWKWLGAKDLQLMQFTGLLDKNGREIYEGDILGCEFGNVEVKWEVQGWQPFVEPSNTQWEVIGNIYENPELLKATNTTPNTPRPAEQEPVKYKRSCPCMNNCCDNPNIQHGPDEDHDCMKHGCGAFCEESYRTQCTNCGSVCYCDL